jgi:cellulose synthase/poly-beta-1,6-N-acetylglucosamine synthase-like glycosyltransferase
LSNRGPTLSIVVPAHQAEHVLPLSLSALLRSDLPRSTWELIVVDDASQDATAVVAARYADIVVRLPATPGGPAYARNRGFEASRGEIVVFVDSDVCVHRDTLRRMVTLLDESDDVAAVFGSYDSTPSHPSLVSEFRNLLHHFVHHRDAGEAETFWAGCGAVRAEVFRQVGMFDEWHYSRPQIEDIELGRRLRQSGHRILLRPEIQGTHLKRWTLRDVMLTDFKHRGVPWTRLLLQEGPNSSIKVLNLRNSEKFCTFGAGLGWAALVVAPITGSLLPLLVLPVVALIITFVNRDFLRFIQRERGLRFAIAMLPLQWLYYGTNVVSAVFGWVLHILLGEPQAPVSVIAGVGMNITTWPPRPSRPRSGIWSHPKIVTTQPAAAGIESQPRQYPRRGAARRAEFSGAREASGKEEITE